jgi:hypothetical protein
MLSAGGIPIPPVPHGTALQVAIHQHYYEVLMPQECNDPLWDPNNVDHWTVFDKVLPWQCPCLRAFETWCDQGI